MEKPAQLLTVQELAKILNISPRTIYTQTYKDAVRPFPIRVRRIGQSIRFHPEDVKRYINES